MSGTHMPQATLPQLIKLASIARHADELLSAGGHTADRLAILALLSDPEVERLMFELDGLALLPVKR